MPDQEAIEVALADLSDVEDPIQTDEDQEESKGEDSTTDTDPEARDDGEDAAEDKPTDTESPSQRRRRRQRERRESDRRELEDLRKRVQRYENREKSLKPPDRANYQSETDFLAAQTAYTVRAQDLQDEAEEINRARDARERAQGQDFRQSVEEFYAEGEKRHQGFTQVINQPGIQFTPAMAEALFDSDDGVGVAMHLAENVAEWKRIASLSPVGQVAAITKLESKIKAPSAPRSKAPSPVKPVRPSRTGAQKPVSEMSMAEYAAHRQKQLSGGD